ncbi:MAG TPA: CPBP family glutamic-type intramembrane protease [Longimicrobiales bacterium]
MSESGGGGPSAPAPDAVDGPGAPAQAHGPFLRLLVNGAGELRALWRLLLFLPVVGVVLGLFASAQPLLQRLTGLSAAAAGAAGALTAALAGGCFMLVVIDRRRPGALGFGWTREVPRELALGIAIAGGALALCVALLAFAGDYAWTPDRGSLGGYAWELLRDLALWGVAAAAEEALFRGYAFQVLVQGLGAAPATLLASAAFALAHRNNPNVDAVALVNIFLAGVLLSVAYLRTRSLWFATAVHVGWNWMMGTVLALPVSGLVLVNTPLYDGHAGGPGWVTGGDFGPEGGLVATAAFSLALVAVALAPLAEAPRMKELRPLVDTRLTR